MSEPTVIDETTSQATTAPEARAGTDLMLGRRHSRSLTVYAERFGLVAIWAIVAIGFAIVQPDAFLSSGNVAIIFGSQTVLLVLAMGALVPSVNGDLDLSLGAISSVASMEVAVLNVQHGLPIGYAALVGVLTACVLGAFNAVFVVVLGNDPLIITLGASTLWTGVIYATSDSNTVGPISGDLVTWVWSNSLFGIPMLFYYGLVLVAVLWYVYDATPLGQRSLFVGQSREVARLSGIRVPRIRFFGFVIAAGIAGVAGVLYIGTTGSADPAGGGLPLLLPAYAAVFLGSTVIRPGRFNALGTAIAVYFLATGITGLQLLGAQQYVQNLFYGVALIVAVAVSRIIRSRS